MAGEWFLGTNPMNQLGNTMGRSPNGQVLPSVAAGIQQQSNAATAAALEAYYAEERRRWNQNYGQKQTELDRNYELAKRSAKTAEQVQALDSWYKRESAALARERLAQDREEFQATTGLGMIKTAAEMSGPDKLFEAYDLNRGYGSMQETPAFLQALKNNTSLRSYGAQGGVPAPKTLDSVAAKMLPGYANSDEARTTENALAAISDIGARGAHQLGPGALEQLTDSERQSFLSGLGKAGFDRATFLDAYNRSRVAQGIRGSTAA